MVLRIRKKTNNFKYFVLLLAILKLPLMNLIPQFEMQYNVLLVLIAAALLWDIFVQTHGLRKVGIFAVCVALYELSIPPVSVSRLGDPVTDAITFYGSAIYHIAFLLALLYYLKVDAKNLIHFWRIVLEALTIANLLTVFLLPDGLYTTGAGITLTKFWLFGYDNDHFVVYSLTLLLMMLDQYLTNGKVLSLQVIVVLLATNIALISLWSVTSFLALLVLTVLILIYKFAVKNSAVINMGLFVIIIVVLLIVLFYIGFGGRIGNIIRDFFVNTLQKDVTFTSRSMIWKRYLARIKEYPFLGNGYESVEVRFARVGARNGGAHNEWIRMLYDGGVFHFGCYIAMLYFMIKRMMRYKDETITYLISAMIFAVSINQLMLEFFEIYWLTLYVFGYRCADIIRCKETQVGSSCAEDSSF